MSYRIVNIGYYYLPVLNNYVLCIWATFILQLARYFCHRVEYITSY